MHTSETLITITKATTQLVPIVARYHT